MCKGMKRSDDEGTSHSQLCSSILFCTLPGISISFEVLGKEISNQVCFSSGRTRTINLAVLEIAELSSDCGCVKENEGNERN